MDARRSTRGVFIEMRQEVTDSATSYSLGFGTILLAWLSDLATVAEQLAMIAGFLLVVVRLAYEIRKWRGDV